MEEWRQKEKGFMDMDNSVVTVRLGEGDIRGINGNRKNTIKK